MTTLAPGGILGITGLIGKGGNASAGVDQNLVVWGLWHLVGNTVSCFVDGVDVGDYVVAADGSVTIDISSADHAVTAARLIASDDDYGESTTPVYVANGAGSVWTNVGIVIGFPFVSQGQRLRAATPQDVGSQIGPALGMTRRTNEYAVLLQDAVVVRFGTLLDPSPAGNMDPIGTTTGQTFPETTAGQMFSGVFRSMSIVDSYTQDGALCWQVDRPWPCTVCAVSQFLGAEE